MGLDWNPGNRPCPGSEVEFYLLIDGMRSQRIKQDSPEHTRFFEISISAYETLNTPRVGFNERATDWIRQRYHKQPQTMPEEDWVRRFHGFYVVELVEPCGGIPRFSNGSAGGYVELFSFRAQFLRDCEDVLPAELLDAAYESKLVEQTLAYGRDLLSVGTKYATTNGLDPADCEASDLDADTRSARFKADIILSAGRWCIFWAERGHMLDAYW